MKMKKYTVGFMFTETRDQVLLIQKERPDWQKGWLNGIGGHIEKGETPEQCMCREFKEEAGGCITTTWDKFAIITDDREWKVHFFRKFVPQEIFDTYKTQTDEEVVPIRFKDKKGYPISLPGNVIRNLNWLIPMALSDDNGIPFYVVERGGYGN
jgi:8-oxo-dGTP diphosphatase